MSYPKTFALLGLVAALAFVPSAASAQGRSRGGRPAPRGSARVYRPPVRVAPGRPVYRTGYRTYRPGINLGFFYGRPGFYGSYVYGSPFYRYGYPAYAYGGYAYPAYPDGYAPYGYGYGGYSGQPYGGVRIALPQRDAEVFVDGYFVGTVDNFDGVLQQANIEAGPHRIEVSAPGFETITFDVNVEPGRTITYRSSMRPLRP